MTIKNHEELLNNIFSVISKIIGPYDVGFYIDCTANEIKFYSYNDEGDMNSQMTLHMDAGEDHEYLYFKFNNISFKNESFILTEDYFRIIMLFGEIYESYIEGVNFKERIKDDVS